MRDKVREIIAQTIGEASMQWSEIPKGVYDSSAACKLIDRTIDKLNSLKPSVEEIEKIIDIWISFHNLGNYDKIPTIEIYDHLAKTLHLAIHDRLNKEE